jgi:hypothetical protein
MPGILVTEHGCDAGLQAEPFVREDVQRIASGSTADHAVVTADPLSTVAPPDTMLVTMQHGVPPAREFHRAVLRI